MTYTLPGSPTPKTFGLEFDFQPNMTILAARVEKFGVDIQSFREPLTRSVREVMVGSIRMNFDVGGRPQWEPLSEYTDNPDGTPLVRSGKLRRIASQINVWTITSEEATIAELPATIFYGNIHQLGAPRLPERPFLMAQDEDIERIVEVFARWLEERIERSGLSGRGRL